MPKMNHEDAIGELLDNENYGTSIFREGSSIVIAIGAKHGQAHCAYMNLHQAREMAEALREFADDIEQGKPSS